MLFFLSTTERQAQFTVRKSGGGPEDQPPSRDFPSWAEATAHVSHTQHRSLIVDEFEVPCACRIVEYQ